MKKAVILIILLNIVMFAACGAAAKKTFDINSIKSYRDIPGVTEEEISAIEKLKASRQSFFYGHMFETEAFILPDGTYAGFTTKFCEILSDLFGIAFVQQFCDWEDLKDGLDQMQLDFTGDLTPTEERLRYYHMTYPIAERSQRIFTLAESTEILSEKNIQGLNIGFLKGSVDAAAVIKGYPELTFKVVEIDSFADGAQMLKSGIIDAFVSEGVIDPIFAEYDFIRSVEFFPLVHTPVSLTTTNPELKPIISVVNKYLAAGGIDKLFEMYKEGDYEYARYKLNKSFTDEERAYLDNMAASGKKIRLALESDNYPVSFYNETDNAFQGIAVEILAEISALTGLNFEVVTTKDTPWSEMLAGLKTGKISILSELLYADTRKNDYIWSSVPYVSPYYALLSKSDYPDLANYQVIRSTVGIVGQYAHEEIYRAWFPDGGNIVNYPTHDAAFDALEKDEIDLFMASEYILLKQLNYREKPGYKVNIRFDVPSNSFFGFNKNETVLRSIIDKAQPYVKTERIARSWTSRVFDYSRKYANERTIYLSIFVAVLFLVLIAGIFLFLKTKRLSLDFEKQTTTLSTIYRSIPDMVFCKDINCTYTSCNASFEDFAGLKEAEIIGKNSVEIFAHCMEMAHSFMETDQKVIKENTAYYVSESWFIYHDGRRKLMETIKTPLFQNGTVTGLLGISRDITEHKAAEEEAKAASVAKSVFLAHMSHEIRTPMNAIAGMAELILRADIPPDIYENALNIKHASANLLSIINDILDFSKIEAGKLEIIPQEYSFVSLINDVLNIIRMRITERPLLLTANIDCKIPNKLIGDEARFRQVLLNILGNAVKYTSEGFVSVAASGEIDGDTDTALLTIEISDSGVGIQEKDIDRLFNDFTQLDNVKSTNVQGTGLGLAIAKKLCLAMGGDISVRSEYGVGSTFTITMSQKFNEYEQFAKVENPGQKNTLVYEPRTIYADSIAYSLNNLGVQNVLVSTQSEFQEALRKNKYPFIFIASFLLESATHLMKSLELDSKLILITEFGETALAQNIRTLTMPAHSLSIANILNDVADGTRYNNNEENILFTAPTARILLVDDVGTNLKVAEGLMSPYKMRIDMCKSGAEAIRLVTRNRYDIIFMDHMMPEMDGIETTDRIRSIKSEAEEGYYQNVPIIALTANAISGMKEMFLQRGLNDFLAKPIEMLKLNAILEKWIPKEKREKYVGEKTAFMPVPVTFVIEGVDVKTGVAMTGGTFENYLKTLAIFYKDGLDKAREITDCLENEDIRMFTIHVHALKSSAASVGAKRLSELAGTLEFAGKNEAVTFIRENADDLLAELKILLQNIKAALPHSQNGGAATSGGDLEFLKSELAKLKAALENMDVRTMDAVMSELESKTWDVKTGETIENISRHILMFEYDEAVALINRLR